MPTPIRAGEKFNEGWIASKTSAIVNYTAASNTYAQLAINERAKALTALQKAFAAGGSWETGLQKYVGNDLMGQAYEDSMNNITTLAPYQIDKIVESVKIKQHLASIEAAVLTLFKNQGTQGKTTVPANITDIGLLPMLMGGMLSYEATLTTQSTPAQVYTKIQAFMNTSYGWPLKP